MDVTLIPDYTYALYSMSTQLYRETAKLNGDLVPDSDEYLLILMHTQRLSDPHFDIRERLISREFLTKNDPHLKYPLTIEEYIDGVECLSGVEFKKLLNGDYGKKHIIIVADSLYVALKTTKKIWNVYKEIFKSATISPPYRTEMVNGQTITVTTPSDLCDYYRNIPPEKVGFRYVI